MKSLQSTYLSWAQFVWFVSNGVEEFLKNMCELLGMAFQKWNCSFTALEKRPKLMLQLFVRHTSFNCNEAVETQCWQLKGLPIISLGLYFIRQIIRWQFSDELFSCGLSVDSACFSNIINNREAIAASWTKFAV